MYQTDHSERNGHRDAGRHQGTPSRRQFDVDRTVEIDAGVAIVGAARQRQTAIQTNNRQTGRHEAEDYP